MVRPFSGVMVWLGELGEEVYSDQEYVHVRGIWDHVPQGKLDRLRRWGVGEDRVGVFGLSGSSSAWISVN